MRTLQQQQEGVKVLVARVVENDCDAFSELEGLAKPLMTHLSSYYSSLHEKFEFEDFYSICLRAMYEACLSYDPRNPSFLSYAKSCMQKQCWRELEHWNAEKRNIFNTTEVPIHLDNEDGVPVFQLVSNISVEKDIERNDFSLNINRIISELFDDKKAEVMRLYINEDRSPTYISQVTGLEYQNTYSIITRGVKRIIAEYRKQYLDNN